MKNRGFTIIEVLAVVVILGVLSSIATISVTRYRQDVRDNELVNLHSTIEAAYDKYRTDMIISGGNPKTMIDFGSDTDIVSKYFDDLTLDGNRLSNNNLTGSRLELKIKGDLIDSSSPDYSLDYASDSSRDRVKDGTCLTETEVNTENKAIKSKCDVDENTHEVLPSKEELLCIVLVVNNKTEIDDFTEGVTQRELCTYFNK